MYHMEIGMMIVGRNYTDLTEDGEISFRGICSIDNTTAAVNTSNNCTLQAGGSPREVLAVLYIRHHQPPGHS